MEQHVFGLTNLGSGSDGNATVIHGPGGAFLLDAGFSARELVRRMEEVGIDPDLIRGVLITHDHGDHTCGCRVFCDRYRIPVYVTRETGKILANRHKLGEEVVLFSPGTAFDLCGVHVEPFSIPHDSPDTVAFTFSCEGNKISVATDLGFVNELVRMKLSDSRILMMESNHDLRMLTSSARPINLKRRIMGRWGHLSNDSAMQEFDRILTSHTQFVLLAHLSGECNRPELVRTLAEKKLHDLQREDITLEIAGQDHPTRTFWAL